VKIGQDCFSMPQAPEQRYAGALHAPELAHSRGRLWFSHHTREKATFRTRKIQV
jgi:hypothetical protein